MEVNDRGSQTNDTKGCLKDNALTDVAAFWLAEIAPYAMKRKASTYTLCLMTVLKWTIAVKQTYRTSGVDIQEQFHCSQAWGTST